MSLPYISSLIPHLRSLHSTLALPSSALQSDLDKIDIVVKAAIDGVILGRESEVKELEREVQRWKRKCLEVNEAMGEKQEGWGGEMKKGASLPDQLVILQHRHSSLMALHSSKSAIISTYLTTLDGLIDFLGPEFVLDEGLTEALGRTSGQGKGKGNSSGLAPGNDGVMEDVGPGRLLAVQKAIEVATAAKAERYTLLIDILEDIRYLAGELSLVPASMSFTHASLLATLTPTMPQSKISISAPTSSSTTFLSTLISYLLLNPPPIEDSLSYLLLSPPLPPSPPIEPTHQLISYLSSILQAWQEEKRKRGERIQSLYGELEAIERRLGGDEGEGELRDWVEGNCGLSMRVIQAYEQRLQQAKLRRKENVGLYIEAARKDIERLWEVLMYGPNSMAVFGAFYDEHYDDSHLDLHEHYMDRLSTEQDLKGSLLETAHQWMDLRTQEIELIEKETGPDRYNTRGGALLQQQKLRKRIDGLKPKLENELLSLVPPWEEQHGQDFLVQDRRILDIIADDRAERAAKKGPRKPTTGATPGRATIARPNQASTVNAAGRTPSTGLSRSQQGKKREAPPSATPTAKRARVTSTEPGSSPLGSRGVIKATPSQMSKAGRIGSNKTMSSTSVLESSLISNLPRPGGSTVAPSGIPVRKGTEHDVFSAEVAGGGKRRMSFKPMSQPVKRSGLERFGATQEVLEEEE